MLGAVIGEFKRSVCRIGINGYLGNYVVGDLLRYGEITENVVIGILKRCGNRVATGLARGISAVEGEEIGSLGVAYVYCHCGLEDHVSVCHGEDVGGAYNDLGDINTYNTRGD